MTKSGAKIEDIVAVFYQPIPDFSIIREKSALIMINFIDYTDFFTKIAIKAGFSEVEASKVLGDFDSLVRKAVNNAGGLLRSWREKGFEILHVKPEAANDKDRNSSENRVKTGLKIPSGSNTLVSYEAVKPRRGELVFSQKNSDAFTSTNLNFVLRNMNVDTLAICGLVTDQDVLFNAIQAVNLGYAVIIVEDACAALTAETHAAFTRWYRTFVNVKSTKEVISMIEHKSGVESKQNLHS